MRKLIVRFALALVLVAVGLTTASAYEAMVGPTGVLKYNPEKAFDGYTLFSPMINHKTTYLIDMEGNVVHKWDTAYTPGLYGMLLPNGNLLRGGALPNSPASIGGTGGIVQEIDWSGKVVWEYKLQSPTEVQHHCFVRMPNGNTLILAWEFKSIEEALAKGRDPKTVPASAFARGNVVQGLLGGLCARGEQGREDRVGVAPLGSHRQRTHQDRHQLHHAQACR